MSERIKTCIFVISIIFVWTFHGGIIHGSTSVKKDTINNNSYYDNVEDVGMCLREKMVQREKEIKVYYKSDKEETLEILKEIFDIAVEHTGVPSEGDYLRKSVRKYGMYTTHTKYKGEYYYEFTYKIEYYTTREQEDIVDREIEKICEQLNLDTMTEYDKIFTIYNYICSNVNYAEDKDVLNYTTYSALTNGKAVCQGYSKLFYRLCLESGIDCRYVNNDTETSHAWNIVEMNDRYYYVDATWGDGARNKYNYFLFGNIGLKEEQWKNNEILQEIMNEYNISLISYGP